MYGGLKKERLSNECSSLPVGKAIDINETEMVLEVVWQMLVGDSWQSILE
jgi:hypothetical protein